MTKTTTEPLLTIKEVAKRANTSEKTIWRRIKTGDLAVIRDDRIVRVSSEDFERYLSRHRQG